MTDRSLARPVRYDRTVTVASSAFVLHNSPPFEEQTYAFATTAAGTVTGFGLVSHTVLTQAAQSVKK